MPFVAFARIEREGSQSRIIIIGGGVHPSSAMLSIVVENTAPLSQWRKNGI